MVPSSRLSTPPMGWVPRPNSLLFASYWQHF